MIDTGAGTAVLLLHGWPHTHRLWEQVAPRLAETHRVVAPDLVVGGSAVELAKRLEELLDQLGIERAAVVGIDAGVSAAVGLAVTSDRVERLAVMEAVLPGVPGAESFGPPWWFGFHQVPGLAESVLVGHAREYVEWFLRAGTMSGEGVGADLTYAFAAAYEGKAALAGGFEHYRAMARTAKELAGRTLSMPVLAVGAHPVGPALASQLEGMAVELSTVQFDYCGHLVPLEAPDRLVDVLLPWLAEGLDQGL